MTDQIRIYDFSDFGSYLLEFTELRKTSAQALSNRQLAKKMGLSSPSLITMVCQGKRVPTTDFLHKLAKVAHWSPEELEYAETLCDHQRAENPTQRAHYADKLRRLHPGKRPVPLEQDQAEFIAKWFHVTILEMTELTDFKPDPQWIAARLGGKITPADANAALERLLRLDLLERTPEGTLQKSGQSFYYKGGTPSQAIANFHKQMLRLAAAAIDEQKIDDRLLRSLVVSVDQKSYRELRQICVEFGEKIQALTSSRKGTDTYNIGLQIFRLTTNEPAKLK